MKGSRTFFLLISVALLGGYIWFVERNRLSPAEKKARERQAFDLPVNQLERIGIQTPDLEVEVFYDGTAWMLETPSGARASEPVVRQLLARFRTLGRGEFITPADMRERALTLADFGLEVPQMRLTLGTGTLTRRYDVGSPNPLGNALYVKEQSSQNVMLVSSDLLEILPEHPGEFRDPEIFPLALSDIRELALVGEDGTLRVEREDRNWRIRDPQGMPADAEPVEALLTKILQSRIIDGIPEPSAAEMDMFQTQRDVIRMGSLNRTVPLELTVGGDVPGQAELCYARISGQSGLITVSRGLRVLARTSPEALRDRRVLTVPIAEIQEIEWTGGETGILLRRDGTEWRMIRPLEARASGARIQSLLDLWSQAMVESFHSPAESPGASAVAARIHFRREGEAGNPEFAFLNGELPPGRARLLRAGGEEVLQVVPDLTRRSPADPLAYLSRQILDFDPARAVRVGILHEGGDLGTVLRELGETAGEGAGSNWQSLQENRQEIPGQADRVVEVLSDLWAERLVTLDAEVAKGLGLDEPSLRISFGLGGEVPQSITLQIHEGLARIQGSPLVFRMPEAALQVLSQPLTRPLAEEEVENARKEPE